jgi:hypothetical protein
MAPPGGVDATMARAQARPKPDPIKIFCGLIGREDAILEARGLLARVFGDIDLESAILPFDFTDYYTDEMGKDLARQWVAFRTLKERSYLALAKHEAVLIEQVLSRDGRRSVNIDPGYVDDAQVVLATAKNFSHRIYIGRGYYAEVTLIYIHGAYKSLEWTYHDYKSPEGLRFFGKVRTLYHKQVRTPNAD